MVITKIHTLFQKINIKFLSQMMSQIWEQKRKFLLSLGTQNYQKPAQLPLNLIDYCICPNGDLLRHEIVLDLAENKLANAENHVEPVRSDVTFVYSDTSLYIVGVPHAK